jgi:hypothetical protein
VAKPALATTKRGTIAGPGRHLLQPLRLPIDDLCDLLAGQRTVELGRQAPERSGLTDSRAKAGRQLVDGSGLARGQ